MRRTVRWWSTKARTIIRARNGRRSATMNLRMRMITVMGLLLTSAVTSGASGAAMAQQKRPITLDDFAKIVSIAGPAISRDGTRIAAVISRVNMKADRHDTQLVLID